jgi:hypothetical protein
MAADLSQVASVIEKYPAFAPLLQIPEVADLLIQASQGNWASDKFQVKLHDTGWWKQTPESGRTWQVLKLTDPAEAAKQSGTMGVTISSLGQMLGVPLDAAQTKWLTEEALGGAWDKNEVQRQVAMLAARKTVSAGTIKQTSAQLNQIAASYGVPLGTQRVFEWSQNIAEGKADQNGFEAFARDTAKRLYPYMGKQLDQGMTVKQIADPYLQIASQTLGVNPDTIDLSDPKWHRALQPPSNPANPAGTKPAEFNSPMSHLDWQRTLMTDPTYGYQYTDSARKAAFDMTTQLEQSFGRQR